MVTIHSLLLNITIHVLTYFLNPWIAFDILQLSSYYPQGPVFVPGAYKFHLRWVAHASLTQAWMEPVPHQPLSVCNSTTPATWADKLSLLFLIDQMHDLSWAPCAFPSSDLTPKRVQSGVIVVLLWHPPWARPLLFSLTKAGTLEKTHGSASIQQVHKVVSWICLS